MTAGALREGKMLRIAALGLIVALGPVAGHAEPVAGPRTPQRVHEVKPGDTLTALAKKYGVTVAVIVKANRLASADDRLKIGQRLVIPPPDTATIARRGSPSQPSGAPRVATPAGAGPPPRLALGVPDFDGDAPLFLWPADGPVISTFGHRRSGWHGGIDIKALPGTPVIPIEYTPLHRRYSAGKHPHLTVKTTDLVTARPPAAGKARRSSE